MATLKLIDIDITCPETGGHKSVRAYVEHLFDLEQKFHAESLSARARIEQIQEVCDHDFEEAEYDEYNSLTIYQCKHCFKSQTKKENQN